MIEPTTFFLDQLTAGICIMFGAMLLAITPSSLTQFLWICMFGTTSIAAFTGGIKHGFFRKLDSPLKRGLWRCTLYSGGLSSSLLLSAVIVEQLPNIIHFSALIIVGIELILFSIFASSKTNYRPVMFHYLLTVGTVVIVLLLTPWKPLTPWVIGALVTMIIAGLLQMSDIMIHRHFNNNDIAHLISFIPLWLLFRAGLLLGSSQAL